MGPTVDTQALIRIGGLVQALCQGFDETDLATGADLAVVDAVEALCSVEAPPPSDADETDEVLAAAVEVLDRELGR